MWLRVSSSKVLRTAMMHLFIIIVYSYVSMFLVFCHKVIHFHKILTTFIALKAHTVTMQQRKIWLTFNNNYQQLLMHWLLFLI